MVHRLILPWVLAGIVLAAAVGDGATPAGVRGVARTTQQAAERSSRSTLANPAY